MDVVDGLNTPTCITLSSDGNHAYITGSLGDSVSWYEKCEHRSVDLRRILKDGVDGVDGLDYAYSVTLSSDGKHAYVTGLSDDAVFMRETRVRER